MVTYNDVISRGLEFCQWKNSRVKRRDSHELNLILMSKDNSFSY